MFRAILGAGVLAILGSVTSAAIVYEPVQYQYRDPVYGRPVFYYGGSNPAVFDAAVNQQQLYHMGLNSIRNIGFNNVFVGPLNDDLLHHGLQGHMPVTYTDLLTPGMNAWLLGYTPDDARNDAYANVPRYFRKADMLESSVLTPDGNVFVPPQAPLPGTIQIMPYHAPTTQPAMTHPTSGPIIIIPKGLLDKKLNAKPVPVASAQ
jgi:hypothetical protein